MKNRSEIQKLIANNDISIFIDFWARFYDEFQFIYFETTRRVLSFEMFILSFDIASEQLRTCKHHTYIHTPVRTALRGHLHAHQHISLSFLSTFYRHLVDICWENADLLVFHLRCVFFMPSLLFVFLSRVVSGGVCGIRFIGSWSSTFIHEFHIRIINFVWKNAKYA